METRAGNGRRLETPTYRFCRCCGWCWTLLLACPSLRTAGSGTVSWPGWTSHRCPQETAGPQCRTGTSYPSCAGSASLQRRESGRSWTDDCDKSADVIKADYWNVGETPAVSLRSAVLRTFCVRLHVCIINVWAQSGCSCELCCVSYGGVAQHQSW